MSKNKQKCKNSEKDIISMCNKWIKWNEKNNVSFKTSDKIFGNGEEKFGYEFGIKPKGQNFSYDFDYNGYKLEVKELYNQSFNSGKEGRIAMYKIKNIVKTIDNIMLYIDTFLNKNDDDYETLTKAKSYCIKFKDIGELSERKCKENGDFDCILKNMNKIYRTLLDKINYTIDSYNANGKKVKYSLYKYFLIAKLQEYDKDTIISNIGNDAYINCEKMYLLEDNYIKEPSKLRNEMMESCKIYENILLIFVDKKKGYYIMNNAEKKIKFQRVTKGIPRFVVNI